MKDATKPTTTQIKWSALLFVFATLMFISACHKKVAPPPPPPPPAPNPPTASLSANPNTINQGDTSTLTWQTTNANDVSIDGIGPVEPSGSRQVSPADSITYHLVAKGSGGTQDATARVTVRVIRVPMIRAINSITAKKMRIPRRMYSTPRTNSPNAANR